MAPPHPQIRDNLKIGMDVSIAIGENDDEYAWVRGFIVSIETTSDYESKGIQVRIDDGTIGRIKKIHDDVLSESKVLRMIESGESKTVEFKETFKIDTNTNQESECVKEAIAKTIAAFMNTHGGFLIIGVDDSENIIGVTRDYDHITMSRINQSKKDRLIREISEYVQSRLKDQTLSRFSRKRG